MLALAISQSSRKFRQTASPVASSESRAECRVDLPIHPLDTRYFPRYATCRHQLLVRGGRGGTSEQRVDDDPAAT